MAYQGSGSGAGGFNNDDRRLQNAPASSVCASLTFTNSRPFLTSAKQYHLPPYNGDGSDDEEAEKSLLHQNRGAPYSGPFDEHHAGHEPPHRPASTYTLTESYAGDHGASTAYGGQYRPDEHYSGTTLEDPTTAYGVPGRAPSPYERSDSSSTEAWRQRQGPTLNSNNLKRYATRKVKLVQGSVLSVDYPVPSAIQNSVQAKYRSDLEGGSEEFTHMRCK